MTGYIPSSIQVPTQQCTAGSRTRDLLIPKIIFWMWPTKVCRISSFAYLMFSQFRPPLYTINNIAMMKTMMITTAIMWWERNRLMMMTGRWLAYRRYWTLKIWCVWRVRTGSASSRTSRCSTVVSLCSRSRTARRRWTWIAPVTPTSTSSDDEQTRHLPAISLITRCCSCYHNDPDRRSRNSYNRNYLHRKLARLTCFRAQENAELFRGSSVNLRQSLTQETTCTGF